MNPKAIHETFLRTIIDGMDELSKNIGDKTKKYITDPVNSSDKKRLNKMRQNASIATSNSIARASSGLIMTYPVLCDSSLNIKSCIMIGKALERRNVTLLQMLLAANQRTNRDIIDYLSDFHTNMDFNKMDIEDLVSVLSDARYFSESCDIPQALMEMIPIKEKTEALEDFRENTNYFFKEDVNESSICNFMSLERNGYNTIYEASDNKDKNGMSVVKTDTDGKEKIISSDNGVDGINKMTSPDIDKNRLLSSEVKKANEAVPTLMLINTIDPNTGVNMQAVVGVKSRMIIVPSNEVVGRILAHYEDSNALLKFIKLTTRETSFIKDFLFAVDRAKLDAVNNSKKGSATSLFNALERRAQNGKVRRLAKTDKQFAKAISSLVISQESVEELKKYNNIDVESAKVIKPIMEQLNLLYFVIVDESSEVVKLFIDGSSEYEEYPFSALEKESSDDSYKKVINLMTKMTK